MAAGYHDTHGKMEGYFKISSKPSLDPGCTVVNAAITMKLWDYIPRWNSSAVSTLSMHQVTEARSGTDWLSQLTWSNKPEYGPAMDYVKTDGSQIGNNLSWDITRAAKEWYEGNGTDYGLVITSDQTASTQYRAWFQYTDHAVMSVTYRNTTGTESYYTYQTQSAVRAGAGYVGDYSSELTVIKDDLSFSNTAMPFGFNHVFNSGLRSGDIYDAIQAGITAPDYSKMRTGYGWQLSVQESIKRVTIDNTIYLVYRDDDGTQHFFSGGVNQNGSVFYDEDGLGLKITLGETNGWRTYTLTDDSGNKKFFYNAYLTYQEDGNGNKIYFVYNGASFSASSTEWYPPQTGAYLSSIVSVNKGQSTPTTICTFAYTNNYLSSITDHAGRVTKFVYANNRLVQIIHPDNTSAYYDYNTSTGHLIEMYDAEAKYGVTYTYTGNAVTSIEEFAANTKGGDKTKGSCVKRSKNGVQEAIYRYDGDDRTFDTTDDIVTRYAFDFAGRTINATTLNYNETQILGVTAAAYTASTGTSRTNNRIEKDAQGGQAGINLLSAGGLEIHDTMTAPANSWKPLQASGTGRSAAVKNTASDSSALTRTGNGSLKIYLKDTATENSAGIRRMGMYQEVSLTAGTAYTFSAYVNTRDVNTYVGDGGLYVAFMDTAGNILAAGDRVVAVTNSEIENGWQRVHVTYTPKTTGTYRVAAIQENAYLYGYFDDFQLETGKAASNVNLLQNGSFGSSAEWVIGNFHTHKGDTLHPGVIEVTAAANSMKRASQTVPVSGPASDTYLLSGWAWAPSVANTESKLTDATAENNTSKRYFGLIAKCTYTDATKEYFYMPFNDDYNGWQYASCVIAPKKDNQSKTIQSITVIAAYDCNANTVWFDNISLRQEPCTTYTYDSKGNITAVNATGNSAGNFTYAAGSSRLTKSTAESTGTYEYAYKNTNNNNLVTKITNDGVSMNIGYDAHGNSVSTKVQDNSGSLASTINTTAEYSNDGAFLTSQTNSNGYKNSYTYNSIRSIASATDSKGTATVTTYYAAADLVNQSFISGVVSLKRSYTDGMLTSIQRGGYIPGNSVKQNQDYNSTYDNFGNNTALAIGSRNLVAYNYGQHNNNMSTMTYGNGDYVEYQYDTLDRLVKETYYDEKGNLGKVYEYFYDAEGNLAKKLDTKAAKAVNYEYDSLGRLIHSWETVNGKVQQKAEHLYDTSNRLSKQVWQLGDTTYSEKYSYNAANGSLGYIKGSGITDWAYEYDPLKRVSAQYNYYFKQNYSYRNINSTTTTTQLSNISYTKRNGGTNFEEFSLAYQYDTLGNISSVTGTTRTDQTASYTYDIQSQLTKEVNTKGTYNYTYDTYGNIRSISGAESHTYTYGDSEWLDLLTAFDGQSITYDAIGNPLSYYNGTRWSFGWENGRQLTSASGNGKTITYTYDMDGIRDSKTVNGTTYNYITQDGLVVRQTWGSNVMDFTYDNNSRPYACVYQGKTYYYVLNLQGDVVGIINNTGAYVAKYAYDAWGNVISQSGWLAATNPIRYRGYYYDQDTGMYYLQTRYYDPVVRRFINADMPELAGGDNTFLGLNLFAYCTNNPVMNMDEDGCLSNGWKIAITAGLLVAATAVIVATGGVASGPVMCAAISAAQGAVTGAVSGAASGAAIGAVTGAIKHRATTGSWKGAGKAAASGAKQGAIDGAFTGAITGAVSGALHPTHCFVAGTAIAAAAGYVAIETLKPGDLVWAWDEETGDVALKPVKQLFINESDELIHLTVNGEEITTTPTHPFYVAHKGWYAAVDLRAGDILVLVNGEYVTLEKTQHEILEAPITVYNFEVEDYHTYYVGTDGVLVHNSCNHNSAWNRERRSYWREQSKTVAKGTNNGIYKATEKNLDRMRKGLAPKGLDGYSVTLHHDYGIKNNFKAYREMTRTAHIAWHKAHGWFR